MSAVKRTRTDELPSSQSQPTTTTTTTTQTVSPKVDIPAVLNSSVEEDFNW